MKKPAMPKTIGAAADALYRIRAERLALQKLVDEKKAEENLLREWVIANLPKSNATGVAGRTARASVNNRLTPQVKDWDKLYSYIVKTYRTEKGAAFTLLQRRVGEEAVKDRWNERVVVPGVEPIEVPVVSVSKL